ncbi:MAG: hypothetical protein F4152_07465, partial [Dehalococcoidia bacterium]|nr:hypothetical protein [Dehalococcoidia bacterium]
MAMRLLSLAVALGLALAVLSRLGLQFGTAVPSDASSGTPEFVDIRTAQKRSSSHPQEISIDVPPGEGGDLLIAVVALARDRTVEAPSGWTLFNSGIADEDEARLTIWYRLADAATETDGVKFTWADGKSRGGAAVLRYRGVDATDPLGSSAFATGETDDPPTAPSVYTPVAAARVLRVFIV